MNRDKKGNFKRWAIVITGLFICMTILTPICQSFSINVNEKEPMLSDEDFTITLHRIREEDEIDPWPHSGPNWQLRMYVNDVKKIYECDGEDVIVDKTFTWPGIISEEAEYVNIKMELLEKDSGIWPDLHDIADISAYIDWDYEEGDYDDTTDFEGNRPAVFKRTYNLVNESWEPIDESNDYLGTDFQNPFTWYVTSGNYDGSTTIDENDATVWFNVSYGNTPPYPPEKPSGPSNGWQGMIYDYSTKGFDIDGDRIKFAWDWQGDSEVDEVTGYYDSWEEAIVPHVWTQGALYYVKVLAIDERGLPSEWSEPLKVRINAPGGINGVEVEEWSLGHVYSNYYNHQKTQEILQILRSGGNIVTALSMLISAIVTAFGVPIPYAAIIAIVSALIRLGVEVINMLDHGMGIYTKTYVIELAGIPVSSFGYVWSQTPTGGEGKAPPGNEVPYKPEKPLGRIRIKPGKNITFSSIAEDPDNDNLTYIFEWDDGNYSCSELTKSKKRMYMRHTWEESGIYSVRVKVLDQWGQESEWSEPHTVTVSKTKSLVGSPFFNFLEKIIERFPFLGKFLSI